MVCSVHWTVCACKQGTFTHTDLQHLNLLKHTHTHRREAAEVFRTQILHGRGGTVCSTPVQSVGPVTYMTMRHGDVYMLCITKSNANAMMAFQFMRSVSVCCRA